MSVTNLMQAIWFGGNFLLYCGCSVHRAAARGALCSHTPGSESSPPGVIGVRGLFSKARQGARARGKTGERERLAGSGYQLRSVRAAVDSSCLNTRLTTAI